MECRPGCGACCIAPRIVQAFHGMPNGKAAGERCVHLDDDNRCGLFNTPERPLFCRQFLAEPEVCGESRDEAMVLLQTLELESEPA
ncbi:MAG: YkgJ family cysteine cluster protein [Chromatocurvus sp.]